MHFRVTLPVHNPHVLYSFPEKNTSALLLAKGSSRAGRGTLLGLKEALPVAEHISLLFSEPGQDLHSSWDEQPEETGSTKLQQQSCSVLI